MFTLKEKANCTLLTTWLRLMQYMIIMMFVQFKKSSSGVISGLSFELQFRCFEDDRELETRLQKQFPPSAGRVEAFNGATITIKRVIFPLPRPFKWRQSVALQECFVLGKKRKLDF